VQVVQPETILRWHRAGFKMFWRWKSRNRAGRPRKLRRYIFADFSCFCSVWLLTRKRAMATALAVSEIDLKADMSRISVVGPLSAISGLTVLIQFEGFTL
jgi:hypothetical protein